MSFQKTPLHLISVASEIFVTSLCLWGWWPPESRGPRSLQTDLQQSFSYWRRGFFFFVQNCKYKYMERQIIDQPGEAEQVTLVEGDVPIWALSKNDTLEYYHSSKC